MLKRVLKPIAVLIEAALIAWVVLFLAEYFGWTVVREAGGRALSAGSSSTMRLPE